MSCEKVINVVQGSDITFYVRFTTENGDPLDLTSATEISAQFINLDGSFLDLTLQFGIAIIDPSTIGKISITLTSEQTALLQVGLLGFETTLVVNASTFVVQFTQSINIIQPLF